ncbi:DNA topoisomerase-1 [Chitinophaga terrae (ex Kim and Jung 2007)]|uniref:DNA topoisomerase 1 n=1 Tax=Chitinophaga terrae (ex Kim and Jung 2007) TaxID=408074 RepID=A0A1H4E1X1_9BACT|nr:type I DNA topoisomerase [Chitinophaga terrae (ex Kim and Jung 2007)]MDQ0108240.1 DNA topoisomerase-1 [Chitinophaga terrae (ex Kim and Jung 2007)]GEP91456.1 DNA topoisomerase 1 [Chitinophaga terrae (ex Kim and Jung 2007)]SEA79033.1 DNA topoisomerase-1 [Chitinophaga terrae (ex Kim and Jung 2007)]
MAKKNLVIVESPAKAKTIEKILGNDFEVKSCFGHIRDLEKDDMGIDIENNFKPKYVIPEDKEKVVKELKKLAKDTEEVWLATDEDREGEAISWHLCEVLNLDPKTTKRIVFHEITKPAIENAVRHPRKLDMDRVNAQQARRILDRIVGFEISPVLWRKMSMRNSLSAGRVQSVAVRLIVEREREINAFQSTSTFKVDAYFTGKDINGKNISFKAEGPNKFKTAEDAEKFLQQCVGAAYTVKDIQVKPGKKSPAAPFTTSTLQQEASRKLGYSVSKTMLLAQKLYESGNITYMRTDSVNLSDTAMQDIEKSIRGQFGDKYYQHRKFKNKNESAQEAHEAIRPTYMENTTVDDSDTRRLYELIWKRTIASQMADAELEKTIAKIDISTNHEELTASGEVLKFDGFLKVYLESNDDDEETEDQEGSLPPLAVKQSLDLKEMKATERFSRPAPRYTEASLVKKLEELGIGRPSTYAPTITTIQKRNYVEKRDKEGVKRDYRVLSLKNDKISKVTETENTGAEKSKLFPTDLGMIVTDFLNQYFNNVMDYGFTAKIEEEFDEIANGKKQWNKMLKEFYSPFHKDVENTLENAERVKGERPLGVDEATGKPIVARMGRYGPMIQIGSVEDEEKPRFAKLKATQSIETITLEEAMELFKLPRNLGQFEGSDVIINIGRFGPYAQHDKKFYSLKKEMDPYTVELDEVAPLIAEKRAAKDERTIKVFEKEKIQILKGPYGPYIKQGLKNFKIPKEKIDHAADLTVEEAKAIIEEAKANPPKKKAAARKKKAE